MILKGLCMYIGWMCELVVVKKSFGWYNCYNLI